MTTAVTDHDPFGPAGAAELLAAASQGLAVADRELLALAIEHDLDSGQIAQVTGEAAAGVYVQVSRLKDALGRAAGALLVARHHRRDCPELDAILETWNGTFDPLWRKRIARHIDRCDQCEDRRRLAGAAVLAAPLPLLAPPAAVRERTLERIASRRPLDLSSAPAAGLGEDGFPEPSPWEPPDADQLVAAGGRSPRAAARRRATAAAAVLVVVLGAVGILGLRDDDRTVLSQSAGVSSTTTTSTTAATSTSTTSTSSTSSPTTTVTTPDGEVVVPPGGQDAPPVDPGQPPVGPSDPVPPDGSTTTSTTTTVPGPVTRLALRPTAIATACGTPNVAQATVRVADGSGTIAVSVSWDGAEPGSVALSGRGPHTVDIGPFSAIDDPDNDGQDTLTVTARAVDEAGRMSEASSPLVVRVAPC